MYPQQWYSPPPLPPRKTSGLAVTGMILGIVAIVTFWVPWWGLAVGVIGAILSACGIGQTANPAYDGRGMAIAGLACSILSLVPAILVIVALGSAVSAVTQ